MQPFLLELTDIGNKVPEYIETIFTLSNGHIGVRASMPIKQKNNNGNPGTFVNGFYDIQPIIYGEWVYGSAKSHQTIVKLPSLREIVLIIDGKRSDEENWLIERETFELNLLTGSLNESYKIEITNDRIFHLMIESFVSLEQQEIFVSQYSVKAANFIGKLTIERNLHVKKLSEMNVKTSETPDPRVAKSISQLSTSHLSKHVAKITTQFSNQSLLLFQGEQTVTDKYLKDPLLSTTNLEIQPEKITTTISYVGVSSFFNQVEVTDEEVKKFENLFDKIDYHQLMKRQKEQLTDFWETSDIQITGNENLQKGLRFNLFQLFQNAGRDGKTSLPAKGLTGEGYEGHYFWDTEVYMLPFFIYTQPDVARQLLRYRCHILPNAQQRARVMNQKSGALFAWRTINGDEVSAYFPAGTAQVHINADISYAFQLYEMVTGDYEFIKDEGAEVIFETARFWLSYGEWILKDGKEYFCINEVTGPDEYTALVNNNYYTNKMAQNNLNYGIKLAKRYAGRIDESEQVLWEKAAKKMYFPYDEDKQLIRQDDSFFDKAIWPFDGTPKENYPLLIHYHPMILYKYQVCKQPDSLMAELLFPQDYDLEQIKRDYDYYEKITTHDSSLSYAIFSILASRIKQSEKAYQYFMDTALLDLTDIQGNVKDGLHAANLGGSWLSMIVGFAGLAFMQDRLLLENNLPVELTEMRFKLNVRENIIEFHLIENKIHANVKKKGQALTIEEQENKIIIWFAEKE